MGVTEIATLRAIEGAGDAFASAVPNALAVLEASEGCHAAVGYRCVERPDEFVFMMRWASIEAHERFRASPRFARYRATLAGVLDVVTGYAHYDTVGRSSPVVGGVNP
jgi:quinol monooxygenase YgiN